MPKQEENSKTRKYLCRLVRLRHNPDPSNTYYVGGGEVAGGTITVFDMSNSIVRGNTIYLRPGVHPTSGYVQARYTIPLKGEGDEE